MVRKTRLHILVLISLFLTTSTSFAGTACKMVLSTAAILLEQKSFKSTGSFEKPVNRMLDASIADVSLREKLLASKHDGKYEIEVVELKYDEGKAYFYFREVPGTDTLITDMISVPAQLRRLGVSDRLIEIALAERPHIRRLVFHLDMTNKEVFDRSGGSLEEKLRSTPAYKAYSKFRFTKIDHVSEVKIEAGWITKIFPHVILSKD